MKNKSDESIKRTRLAEATYGLLFLSLAEVLRNAHLFGYYFLQASIGADTDVENWDPIVNMLALICITFCYHAQTIFKHSRTDSMDVTALCTLFSLTIDLSGALFPRIARALQSSDSVILSGLVLLSRIGSTMSATSIATSRSKELSLHF